MIENYKNLTNDISNYNIYKKKIEELKINDIEIDINLSKYIFIPK